VALTHIHTHIHIRTRTHVCAYVKRLSIDDNDAISFNISAISLSVLHNYFNDRVKLFFRAVSI